MQGSFFREQALALKRAGHRVGVIAPIRINPSRFYQQYGAWRGRVTVRDEEGIRTYRHYGWQWLPLVRYGEAFLFRRATRLLFERYIKEQGLPDLIHAHSALYGGVSAASLKDHYHIPYIITEHNSRFGAKQLPSWKIQLARQMFGSASARIAVSSTLGKLLESIIGEEFVPWQQVPNLVDPSFKPADSPKSLERPFIFLNIAYMTERKRQSDLIQAFAEQFQNQPKVQLRLGGDGPLRSVLQAQARSLGIGQQVHFLGLLDRSKVLSEMQSADAFVLSSRHETFGVVLVEALACGKPVIATACGGPQDIVHQGNGLLVPLQNIADLGRALHWMKEHITSYDPQVIRSDCLARFGEQTVAAQLTEIYEMVLHRM